MSIRDRFDTMSETGKVRVLDALGLEPKPQTTDFILPALGIFGAGLIVGAVVGLMVAPKAGTEIRQDIRHRASDLGHRIQDRSQAIRQRFASEDEEAMG